eukprot:TRINITY_DN347_c0_g2_i8.p1 TRINITY_DN347_c0_g2~~TRINITY_DN347_c0_g2_i8.p1  ORF type:complete len:349 (+),score=68.43 TRINITY_DN347_c0_g2_i8:453-1499(+)
MVPPASSAPPPRRRAAFGTGRPRTSAGGLLSTPVQEVNIPTTYTLAPTNGAGPPTRALYHFVVTRLRPSPAGPAGMPASLCELDEPGTELAAGGVLMAPGLPPLTVSLPRLSGWFVEVGGDEPRLLATTPTGQYRLVGRPAGSYVSTHGRARRRFELLVRSVALATRLPPADATYAKMVRQLGRRAAGMRAYSEADVLAEAPYLLSQSRRLDDPALRCSLLLKSSPAVRPYRPRRRRGAVTWPPRVDPRAGSARIHALLVGCRVDDAVAAVAKCPAVGGQATNGPSCGAVWQPRIVPAARVAVAAHYPQAVAADGAAVAVAARLSSVTPDLAAPPAGSGARAQETPAC